MLQKFEASHILFLCIERFRIDQSDENPRGGNNIEESYLISIEE